MTEDTKPPEWMVDRAKGLVDAPPIDRDVHIKAIIEAMQEAGREVAFYFAGQAQAAEHEAGAQYQAGVMAGMRPAYGLDSQGRPAYAPTQAAPVQPSEVAEHGELDPRIAQLQARAMARYVEGFTADTIKGFEAKNARQFLANALDHLYETAAMLGNMADRVATPAPKASAQPSVTRETVIEWLDALDIEVTDRQLNGLFHEALAAPQAAEARKDQWQPIETAPKDAYVLLWVDIAIGPPLVVQGCRYEVSRREKGWIDTDGNVINATHWMPLPAAPDAHGIGSQP